MAFERTQKNTGTTAVRPGCEIDAESLTQWMTDNIEGFRGPLIVSQFKGGQSNPTYKLDTPDGQYVLRRKPSGELLRTAHAVDREYRILSALSDTDVPVPKTYGLCLDENVIGVIFYVMEYKEGRVFWDLLADGSAPEVRRQLWFAAIDAMASLHLVDYKAVGLEAYGKPGNYVERQFHRWSKQYQASREAVDNPAMDRLVEWIGERIPRDFNSSLIHGDLQFSNMMFAPKEPKVIALLDWELSTIGNPLCDLAYFCRVYHLPEQHGGLLGVDYAPLGIPQEEELVAHYCARTHFSIDHWAFYLVFGMFRLAAIRQGVAQRVLEGTAASDHAVEVGKSAIPVADSAWRIAERG